MASAEAVRAAVTLALLALATAAAAEVAPERQRELERLLRHDCGSCHGLRMTGGLGPALTPEALAGTPDRVLGAAIARGRPGTPMPPWDALLTPAEIEWLIQTLRRGSAR